MCYVRAIRVLRACYVRVTCVLRACYVRVTCCIIADKCSVSVRVSHTSNSLVVTARGAVQVSIFLPHLCITTHF